MSRTHAALIVVAVAMAAHARPPDVVRWQDAAAHVGRVITVEGTVARARVAGGACTLEFAPDDASALRVVLMLSLFQSPDNPERLYAGHRVQASGRVQQFQGRPEIIIRRADQITVMDEPAPTSTSIVTTTTTTTTRPIPVAPVPAAPAPPPSSNPSEACARSRDLYQAARRELALRSEQATRCLQAEALGCQNERAAVSAALEALSLREAQTNAACR